MNPRSPWILISVVAQIRSSVLMNVGLVWLYHCLMILILNLGELILYILGRVVRGGEARRCQLRLIRVIVFLSSVLVVLIRIDVLVIIRPVRATSSDLDRLTLSVCSTIKAAIKSRRPVEGLGIGAIVLLILGYQSALTHISFVGARSPKGSAEPYAARLDLLWILPVDLETERSRGCSIARPVDPASIIQCVVRHVWCRQSVMCCWHLIQQGRTARRGRGECGRSMRSGATSGWDGSRHKLER